MDRRFQITARGSTVRREIVGGITTFFAMAYIIFVNPNTLCANVGTQAQPFFPAMPESLWGPVLVATCVSAAIGCFLTGLLANLPFAQAPGMGLNAFFTYTVCLGMGYTWQEGLAIVLLSGLLFLAFTLSPLRGKLIRAIPDFMKHAISAGIGLFIALIGLLNVKVITLSGTVPALQLSTLVDGQRVWNVQGLLALAGLLLTAVLMAFRVKGAVVLGIVITTLVGLPLGVTQIPETVTMEHITLAPVLFQMDLGGVLEKGLLPLLTAVISFAIVDCFDTLGALVGLSANVGLKEGTEKRSERALVADALATCCGACVGTSTVTTFCRVGGRHCGRRAHRSELHSGRSPVPVLGVFGAGGWDHSCGSHGPCPDHRRRAYHAQRCIYSMGRSGMRCSGLSHHCGHALCLFHF